MPSSPQLLPKGDFEAHRGPAGRAVCPSTRLMRSRPRTSDPRSPIATTGALVSRSRPPARTPCSALHANTLALTALLSILAPGWALATPVQGPCQGTRCEAFELL